MSSIPVIGSCSAFKSVLLTVSLSPKTKCQKRSTEFYQPHFWEIQNERYITQSGGKKDSGWKSKEWGEVCERQVKANCLLDKWLILIYMYLHTYKVR